MSNLDEKSLPARMRRSRLQAAEKQLGVIEKALDELREIVARMRDAEERAEATRPD